MLLLSQVCARIGHVRWVTPTIGPMSATNALRQVAPQVLREKAGEHGF